METVSLPVQVSGNIGPVTNGSSGIPKRTREKVAVLGFAPHWNQAPFNDSEWEIWGINQMYRQAPRLDVLFEMHTPENLELEEKAHVDWLKTNTKTPVYMFDHYPQFPMSIKYPLGEIVKEYGSYFTSSISYMLALAIEQGYSEIGVYGVDMAQDSEYGPQRSGCELYIGMALGKGIEVYIPPASDLFKCFEMYGQHSDAPMRIKLQTRLNWLQEQMNHHKTVLVIKEKELEIQRANVERVQGAMDEVNYELRSFAWSAPVTAKGSPVPQGG